MNTIRLTVTPEVKNILTELKAWDYSAMTDAELLKLGLSKLQAESKLKRKKKVELDYSDPTPEEMMRQAEYIFSLDEGDQYDEPFWDESTAKPINPKDYV